MNNANAIQPAALVASSPLPGPRNATAIAARAHTALVTELEDGDSADREVGVGDGRRRRNEPHVELLERISREVQRIHDVGDLEDLIDAAAGRWSIRIACR